MEKKDQERIINEILDNLRHSALKDSEKIPQSWNGLELRWFIQYKLEGFIPLPSSHAKRRLEFWNDILINGL